MRNEGLPKPAEVKPIPDPSALTTDSIYREVSAIKEFVNMRVGSVEVRIDGMDKSLEAIWSSITTALPLEVDKQITHVTRQQEIERQAARELNQERYNGVMTQFEDRDERLAQSTRDNKAAVEAALLAAKEAVGEQNKSSALAISKSEMAVTKQMDQLGQLIHTTNSAMNDKIDDIKVRLTLIEGKGTGLNAGWGMLIGAAALAAALMSIFNVVKGANGAVIGG